jgi:allophanate hydrolase subunit 1
MSASDPPSPLPPPLLQPLGDSGLIVRFAGALSDAANRAAIRFAAQLREVKPEGVCEVQSNLVSVLLTYDPARIGWDQLAGEVRLLLARPAGPETAGARHHVAVTFDGPDVEAAAAALGLSRKDFITRHSAAPLRVLATGFAPGFVYCGFHDAALALRQTAITATPVPTGWHVLGHTAFRNFRPEDTPPTRLREGDEIVFEALA